MHSIEIAPGRRIPLPRPVPYVNVLYFAAVVLLIAAADNVVSIVSIVGAPLALVAGDASIAAWVCCYVLIPAGIVWLAANSAVDGRAPHRWVVSVVRYYLRPKRTICGRPVRREGARVAYSGRVRFWWDLEAPRLHHGWIRGGQASSSVPVRFTHALRHRHRVFEPDDGGATLSGYDVDQVEVRP